MFKITNLTVRNFLSVGNSTQTVNFDRNDLTLVLGENLDLGGDDHGARNGTGKCVCGSTKVKIRNTRTGEIIETTISELYRAAQNTGNGSPKTFKKQ